jgi:hypothetical protein
MEIKETKKLTKNLPRFFCEGCHFKCYMKCDWERHIIRPKHLASIQGNGTEPKNVKKTYNCSCGKNFLSKSGLWKHKNICNKELLENDNDSDDKNDNNMSEKDLIMMLLKQNSELLEVIKNGTHNTITNNTNSNNKAFNLNFFLNETCKNAMNITEFVDSIQYQLSEFEKMSEIGYVEGISNIIVKNLNALDVTQRPLHCTDKKRETIYIKDQDKWEKGDEENTKIRKVIKKVANKNAMLIHKFTEKHPDFKQHNSKYSTQYHKLIIESLGGAGDNDVEKEDKIIRNISKSIVVDKDENTT